MRPQGQTTHTQVQTRTRQLPTQVRIVHIPHTMAPTVADPNAPTPNEVCTTAAWKLQAARAYAEIVLHVEDEYGEVIVLTDNPHNGWTTLESSYGLQQSGIQAVINAELTLA